MRLFRRPDGRYYVILQPTVDLFGDPIVMTYHGSQNSHQGGCKTYYCADGNGSRAVDQLVKLRLAHGYKEVEA